MPTLPTVLALIESHLHTVNLAPVQRTLVLIPSPELFMAFLSIPEGKTGYCRKTVVKRSSNRLSSVARKVS
jgi:hypothetical protein